MNLEVNINRIDEIVFPHDSTMIMQKINAQIAEFNPTGTMVAIGCKYASILIMDFMTKEIVRCFSLYEDYDLDANCDVDQFSHFRRLNYAYLEDDFVLIQKPQDEKDSDTIVKREYKKIIHFEPKDKSKCKAQISSIDWSLDSKFIVVSFKIENQVVVWDIKNCTKILHMTSQQLNLQQIYSSKFFALNPNYILISGDKAIVLRVNNSQKQEYVILADTQEQQPDSQHKLDSPQQHQSSKRKGPKFSPYIFQSLIHDGAHYYLLINNTQKVIMILEDQKDVPQKVKIKEFFHVVKLKKFYTDKDQEMKDESSKEDQEQEEKSELSQEENSEYLSEEDDVDLIHYEEIGQIKDAISWINAKKFKILSIIRFQTQNSFVQQLSVNDSFTKLILTCSDRVLRLYEIKYQNLHSRKKSIFLSNEFQDVINRRKWMNASFLRLNSNTKISEQQSQVNQLLNELQQQWTNSVKLQENKDQIMNKSQQEIFVSSIGESGSNELKFYNADDFSIIQRLELTQEGCCYLTAHSKSHFSILMVTTNGSLFLWSVRPAKIIQPLAPYFNEIEENQDYIEREDEFEKEISDEEEKDELLTEDEKKMKKLAKVDIDINSVSPFHLCNYAQVSAMKNRNTNNLESLFDQPLEDQDYQFTKVMSYVPSYVSNADSYGLLAKFNTDSFRDKFNKLCNQN